MDFSEADMELAKQLNMTEDDTDQAHRILHVLLDVTNELGANLVEFPEFEDWDSAHKTLREATLGLFGELTSESLRIRVVHLAAMAVKAVLQIDAERAEERAAEIERVTPTGKSIDEMLEGLVDENGLTELEDAIERKRKEDEQDG